MPKTHEFSRNFTDMNDIADETLIYDEEPTEKEEDEEISDEYEYDMEAVKRLLEELSLKFKTIKSVRPTCEEVEKLLLLTDHNSWSDFQKQFKNELSDYFETTTAEPLPEVNKTLLIQAEKKRDAVKAKIIEVEKTVENHKKALIATQAKLNSAEMEILATEGMEWSDEHNERNKKATKMAMSCKHQLKMLETKDPSKQLKQLYTLLRFREGGVKFATAAINGDFRILINTGRVKEDARLYQKVAESCVWEINRLLDRETEAERKMAEERFSGADLGVARQTFIGMETTSGGVYESAVEQLHRIRDDMEEAFATYSACLYGYELAAQMFVPSFDREWFPEIPELDVALRQARQRAHTASINRAKQQLEAAKELLKR